MNKKDALPIIIASVIALVVTIIVKWFLPTNSITAGPVGIQNISMPEVPLMTKKTKKKYDCFVLFVSKEFKKDEKIILGRLRWDKWPASAMQPYFIAKDHEGIPLNNGADYSNALKMWAKNDIPEGVPLTMAMLTDVDPKKKKAEEKRKKKAAEEEAKAKEKKKKEDEFIKKGMRAVTFQIDQRSATSTTILKSGDLVDVLIMEQRGDKTKSHKYKGLKILAIDGITRSESSKNNKNSDNEGGFLSGVGIVSNFMTPKNVTLEVREELVETMLKQASTNGIILSIRSQTEATSDKDGFEVISNDDSDEPTSALNSILSMTSPTISSVQIAEAARQREAEATTNALMDSIVAMNARGPGIAEKSKSASNKGGRYEVISGKIVGEDDDDSEEAKNATIYRKLTASTVEFDENGKVSSGGSSGGGAVESFSGK